MSLNLGNLSPSPPSPDWLRMLPHCACGSAPVVELYGPRRNLACVNPSCPYRPSVWMTGWPAVEEAWCQIVQIVAKHKEGASCSNV